MDDLLVLTFSYGTQRLLDLDSLCSKNSDVHLESSLIDMYSRSTKVVLRRKVFDQMKNKNVYVWMTMVNGYIHNEALKDALVLLCEMQMKDRIRPNKVSLVSVLPSCGLLAGLIGGKQAHDLLLKWS
ncbi:hypothetical protein Fmac_021086 [Flemingia macrophylla]|uniref:Pentatricopeptide repeat-containing protein n=1 Tax=Flemingia macrophylla TaxID=520843 RepID=A0ABD1LVW6_9FABA